MTPASPHPPSRRDTLPTVSSKGTDLQSFRIDLDLWKRFAEAAKARGSDRSKVLRDFIREYVGEAAVETEPHQRQPKGQAT